eukprot:TRINITY_DN16258_c0_g1_i2.p1 TRINITY_DN16258_c0_g1~~TRINITY_DN16258_c0_g1_i2.p1  ORF type:complete len:981 (+),score=300.03 TRINITY_DN16258_c0_g1_i2:187-2943(+)
MEEEAPVAPNPLAGFYEESVEEKERARRESITRMRTEAEAMRKQQEQEQRERERAASEEIVEEWVRRGPVSEEVMKKEYLEMLKAEGITPPKSRKLNTVKKKKKKGTKPAAQPTEPIVEEVKEEVKEEEVEEEKEEEMENPPPATKRSRMRIIGRTSEIPQLAIKTKTLEKMLEKDDLPGAAYESFVEGVAEDTDIRRYGKIEEFQDDPPDVIESTLSMIEAKTDEELRTRGIEVGEVKEIPEGSFATVPDEPEKNVKTHHGVRETESHYVRELRPKAGLMQNTLGHVYRDGTDDVYIFGNSFNKDAFKRYTTWEDVYQRIPPTSRGDPLVAVVSMVEQEQFDGLTTVQKYALPLVTEGHHLLCQAPTGTGKTLCYILPALQHLATSSFNTNRLQVHVFNPKILILCGNRPSAIQTNKVFKQYSSSVKSRVLLLTPTEENEVKNPSKGCNVIIGTLDYTIAALNKPRPFHLRELTYVVIDDPNQHYGRISKLLEIIKAEKTPSDPQCQVTVWSATVSRNASVVAKAANKILAPHIPLTYLKVGRLVNQDISHKLIACSSYEKIPTLQRMVASGEVGQPTQKTIIFCASPDEAYSAYKVLSEWVKKMPDSPDIAFMTGAMDRTRITKVIKAFTKSGNILITTGIATTGYNVPDVDVVVCLGVPHTDEEWVHAVGRCARGGRQGKAITVITPICAPKLLSSSSGYSQRRDLEEGVQGLGAKKLDISPEVLALADRMGYALDKLGLFSRQHKLAHDGVTFDGSVDKYDPSVNWRPTGNPEVIRKRRNLIKKSARKNYLRGAWKIVSARYVRLVRKQGKVVGVKDASPVAKALQAREERNRERLEQLEALRNRHIKDYRSSQITLWRHRTGIADGVPENVFTPNIISQNNDPMTMQTRGGLRVTRRKEGHKLQVRQHEEVPV